jgi:hypothetical protein
MDRLFEKLNGFIDAWGQTIVIYLVVSFVGFCVLFSILKILGVGI